MMLINRCFDFSSFQFLSSAPADRGAERRLVGPGAGCWMLNVDAGCWGPDSWCREPVRTSPFGMFPVWKARTRRSMRSFPEAACIKQTLRRGTDTFTSFSAYSIIKHSLGTHMEVRGAGCFSNGFHTHLPDFPARLVASDVLVVFSLVFVSVLWNISTVCNTCCQYDFLVLAARYPNGKARASVCVCVSSLA